MKSLLEHLNSMSVARQQQFAEACGTTVGYLRQIGYGHRECQAAMAIDIDRESGGEISCESLCPSADWDYVRTTPKRTIAAGSQFHQINLN